MLSVLLHGMEKLSTWIEDNVNIYEFTAKCIWWRTKFAEDNIRFEAISSWQYHSMYWNMYDMWFQMKCSWSSYLEIYQVLAAGTWLKSFVLHYDLLGAKSKMYSFCDLNSIDATIFTSDSDQLWNEECKSAKKSDIVLAHMNFNLILKKNWTFKVTLRIFLTAGLGHLATNTLDF